MDKTSLGDRMKGYEKAYSQKLIPTLPIIARLDGRSFSKFTKNMERPYDIIMSTLMKNTCKFLVEETDAQCGYTQSDEITLGWHYPSVKSQMLFDGKIEKLDSILAAMCSVKFNHLIVERREPFWEEKFKMMPVFDCRVFNVPNIEEGSNCFLWREQDATRNSIQSAAHSCHSGKELFKKDQPKMLDMLIEKGINWNDYPPFFKRGSYFKKRSTLRKCTEEELKDLPEKHQARKNPDLTWAFSVIERMEWEPLTRYTIEERAKMIFESLLANVRE